MITLDGIKEFFKALRHETFSIEMIESLPICKEALNYCSFEPIDIKQYTILQELGHGTLGMVFKARDPEGNEVAIKESSSLNKNELKMQRQ